MGNTVLRNQERRQDSQYMKQVMIENTDRECVVQYVLTPLGQLNIPGRPGGPGGPGGPLEDKKNR